MSETCVLRKCATTEEALVVVALLRDEGFHASLDNWHYATMNWGDIAAIGGVAVRVRSDEALAAGRYLIEMHESANARLTEATGPLDATPLKRRRLLALSMLFLYFGGGQLIGLPALFALDMMTDGWFPQDETLSIQVNTYYVGTGHISYDTLPTILMLAGLIFFTILEMFPEKQSKPEYETDQ